MGPEWDRIYPLAKRNAWLKELPWEHFSETTYGGVFVEKTDYPPGYAHTWRCTCGKVVRLLSYDREPDKQEMACYSCKKTVQELESLKPEEKNA